MTLADDLRSLLSDATATVASRQHEALTALSRKLDQPLQVAIAGRVKAGKSTLLNALIGERLAPTDASECTRIVTWYRYSDEYSVVAEMRAGTQRELPFHRASDGELQIDMALIEAGEVDRLVVGWPSARLRAVTLIDTPGLDSLSSDAGERTYTAIAGQGDHRREADAVLYLMRHAHRSDITFLEAFQGESVRQGTPVNSIAVLSRADEIGAGRLDALDSARWIARRYAADPRVSSLAATVVSVAGLLAETAATLEESEAESLRRLASEDSAISEALLLSADNFREPGVGPLTIEIRDGLLRRLGMFGLRFAIQGHRDGQWTTAAELSRVLAAHSGVPTLREAIQGRFGARSRQLISRSVLLDLQDLSRSDGFSDGVARRLDQIESGAQEFAELAMLDMVMTGEAAFSAAEREEALRVTSTESLAVRAGLATGGPEPEIQTAAIVGVERWRERAADPLASRITVRCAETMARCYEGLYAATSI